MLAQGLSLRVKLTDELSLLLRVNNNVVCWLKPATVTHNIRMSNNAAMTLNYSP